MADTTPKNDEAPAEDVGINELDGVSGGINPQPLPPMHTEPNMHLD